MPQQDEVLITLVDEEGNEHDVLIFDVLEVEGKKYAIVVPVVDEEEEEEEEAEAFILRIDQDEDGDDILVEIEKEEWEKVKDACMEELSLDVMDE